MQNNNATYGNRVDFGALGPSQFSVQGRIDDLKYENAMFKKFIRDEVRPNVKIYEGLTYVERRPQSSDEFDKPKQRLFTPQLAVVGNEHATWSVAGASVPRARVNARAIYDAGFFNNHAATQRFIV